MIIYRHTNLLTHHEPVSFQITRVGSNYSIEKVGVTAINSTHGGLEDRVTISTLLQRVRGGVGESVGATDSYPNLRGSKD